MSAELRRSGGTVWVVDLECGLEEPWGDDHVGAHLCIDDHNETHHGRLDGDEDDEALTVSSSTVPA